MAASAVVAVLLAALIGVQGWRVLSTIVQAERASVVPLPERSPDRQIASASPISIGGVDEAIPSDGTSIDGSAAAQVSIATPTASAVAAASQPGSTSQFDVVRQVVAAGLDTSDPGTSGVWQGKTSLTILVAGVDRRKDGGDQNADVIILSRVDLISKRVTAVSLPRDLLVPVPGVGDDKINSAYNYGVQATPKDPAAGIALLRDTIEADFGVPIDGYVLIDFNGFKDVVDAFGGVDVDVPYAIDDAAYPTEDYGVETIHFDAGPQHFNGDQALKYVRTRHADSDDARRNRQLQVLMALFGEGKNLRSIANANKLIAAGGKSVQTSFPLAQQLQLARLALQTDQSNIRLSTLGAPILTGQTLADGRWVYTGDAGQITQFVQDALRIVPAGKPNQPVSGIASVDDTVDP